VADQWPRPVAPSAAATEAYLRGLRDGIPTAAPLCGPRGEGESVSCDNDDAYPRLIDLSRVPAHTTAPAPAEVCGLSVLLQHAQLLYGVGGCGKSWLALRIAGDLARSGQRVAYLDWESTRSDMAGRLRALFGPDPPRVLYASCAAPLAEEAEDWLGESLAARRVQFVVVDSAGPACGGKPEEADSALRLFRAIRELRVGALVLAHQSKADGGERAPFGSVFWVNSARAVWHIEARIDGGLLRLVLRQRKNNYGPLAQPVGLHFQFGEGCVVVEQVATKDARPARGHAKTGERQSVADRIREVLQREGPMLRSDLGNALPELALGTLDRILRRELSRGRVVKLEGGLITLPEVDGCRTGHRTPDTP
jgi:hypothetical protein